MKPTVSIIIPVRNEKEAISQVLDELHAVMDTVTSTYEILVNDDASTDGTAALLDAYAVTSRHLRVFHQNTPLGIAGGVEFLYAKAQYSYIIIHSGDGEYTAEDFPSMIRLAQERYDIVIGNRVNKQYTLWRKLVSSLYNRLAYILFRVPIYDAGSIKVYRRRVIETIIPISKGVYNEAERIIRATKAGLSVCAVPAHHNKRHSGIATGAKMPILVVACTDIARLWYLLMVKRVSPLTLR